MTDQQRQRVRDRAKREFANLVRTILMGNQQEAADLASDMLCVSRRGSNSARGYLLALADCAALEVITKMGNTIAESKEATSK